MPVAHCVPVWVEEFIDTYMQQSAQYLDIKKSVLLYPMN